MDKIKLELKFSFKTTRKDLFLAITKPHHLQNWIAEKVELDQTLDIDIYTFHWREYSESAKIEEMETNQFVKWVWIEGDHEEGEYVSFRIEEVKGDEYLDLHIVDFCEPSEERDLREGWDKQMTRLEQVL